MQHKVYKTNLTCPFCHKKLVRLDPPYEGWAYWCVYCNMLVVPVEQQAQIEARISANEELGLAIGYVIAVESPFSQEQAEAFRRKLEGE